MTRDDFRELFMRALERAAELAEQKLSRSVPRDFVIELHAPGFAGEVLTVEQALDQLFLGEDRFYRIIDVSLRKILPNAAQVFVRVSGHRPGAFAETFAPADLGPFKQLIADCIEGGLA